MDIIICLQIIEFIGHADEHIDFADKVYEKINYYAIKSSMKISKEKGAYE